MIQLLPQRRQLLQERSQSQSERFSKTQMWKDVMGDLTRVRGMSLKLYSLPLVGWYSPFFSLSLFFLFS